MYRNYIGTRFDRFPTSTQRVSGDIVKVAQHVYLAVVPTSLDLSVQAEHISMLLWAISDTAARSVMENIELERNSGVLPPTWARRASFAQYQELSQLPGSFSHATYHGVTGKFIRKNLSFSDQVFSFAGAGIEPNQLPSVVCFTKS